MDVAVVNDVEEEEKKKKSERRLGIQVQRFKITAVCQSGNGNNDNFSCCAIILKDS